MAVLEYSPEFIASGLTVNPFFANPSNVLVRAKEARTFDGLHGIFAGSLPDAWGQLLVSRWAEAAGVAYSSLTVLNRLAVVGTRGMGALTYQPETAHAPSSTQLDLDRLATESLALIAGVPSDVLAQIEELGGSSGGARPKLLVGMNQAGEMISGAHDMPSGYEAWIVKFRDTRDVEDAGPLEAAYASMARAAGLEIAETTLLTSRSGPGYFATKRFDRESGGSRLHLASVAGLLDTDWQIPSLDYDMLLKITMSVTRRHNDVEKMFRRMVFNVIAHNRDDHTKQHSFLMDAAGTWRLAPAYDLTFSRGPGGEHYCAVGGKGKEISLDDMVALGKKHGISTNCAYEAIEMTCHAVDQFARFARDLGVTDKTFQGVKKVLDAT